MRPAPSADHRLHADASAPPMLIEQWNPSGDPSNTYLVADAVTGDSAIIDPVEAHVASYRARLTSRGCAS